MAFGYCRYLRLFVRVFSRLSVNHKLVYVITCHPFKLESPNIDQNMQNILLKVPIVLEADWT